MVANITTGKDVYGALAYNQEKVNRGVADVIGTHIIREPDDGDFTVAQTAADLLRWIPVHHRTEKPVVHISLNPDPKDILSDTQLQEIADEYMQRMGWGEQPYIVYKHNDIDRTHIHIVTIQVTPDGRKINDSHRNRRSIAATEALEKKYGLHPTKGQHPVTAWQPAPVIASEGNIKKQLSAVIKPLLATYRFQTLGEFRALLSLYNIGLEEVIGERKGKPYRGLLYTALDTAGNVAATPMKSSIIGHETGSEVLEQHMRDSGEKIKKDDTVAQTRQTVEKAMSSATTEEVLREKLRKYNIDLFLRRNDAGRIVGATFIDHDRRVVMNGSRLGKTYSANAFNERLTTPAKRIATPKQTTPSGKQIKKIK